MDSEKRSFHDILYLVNRQIKGEDEADLELDEDSFLEQEHTPLVDSVYNEILMHRDIHFGCQFEAMLEYYRNGGKGIQSQITEELIQTAWDFESESDQNLAPVLLSVTEIERVIEAKALYDNLRKLYEEEYSKNVIPRLIADLILSEEEEPQAEMEALIEQGIDSVPYLLELVRADHFYDPFFPGYGLAPMYAAECLGEIKDERAITPLFEMLGKESFFLEEAVLSALQKMGSITKNFLIMVLTNRPMTLDNEQAAIALSHFSKDKDVAIIALEQLKDPAVLQNVSMSVHLILLCRGLVEEEHKKTFDQITKSSSYPEVLRADFEFASKYFSSC